MQWKTDFVYDSAQTRSVYRKSGAIGIGKRRWCRFQTDDESKLRLLVHQKIKLPEAFCLRLNVDSHDEDLQMIRIPRFVSMQPLLTLCFVSVFQPVTCDTDFFEDLREGLF